MTPGNATINIQLCASISQEENYTGYKLGQKKTPEGVFTLLHSQAFATFYVN